MTHIHTYTHTFSHVFVREWCDLWVFLFSYMYFFLAHWLLCINESEIRVDVRRKERRRVNEVRVANGWMDG